MDKEQIENPESMIVRNLNNYYIQQLLIKLIFTIDVSKNIFEVRHKKRVIENVIIILKCNKF